ncbi:c-type cytochrome [Antarcticimicrobium luteum]|uniref:C-type cytochrome n=1 Tax=Antarcticimicrobium luteum TaxID=2547397 RepID=A0A4R5UQ64_9RHOB|nr:c-type cytochrome [Antarcticimicrobium luteum]TDK41036.1 c-type cytochrome [Antarcticimicrobium luteum]
MTDAVSFRSLIAVPVLAVLAACAAEDEMPGPQEGAMLFAENCTACHDYGGQGGRLAGGRAAPDLTRISARSDGAFPRARVLSQIDGYGHGKVSAQIMPEFGALLEGELVPVDIDGTLTPTPRPLAALLAYLESIQVDGEG